MIFFQQNRIYAFYKKYKTVILQVLFTFGILIVFRIGSYITIPGIIVKKELMREKPGLDFINLITMLGGGGLRRFSLFALGVSPYITASIISQLLSTDLVPILTRWNKEGDKGRKKLEMLTRILTVPFSIGQSFAIIYAMRNSGLIELKWDKAGAYDNVHLFYYFLIPVVLLAGTMLTLWIGDQITMKGVGNGISLIIATGIIIDWPLKLKNTFTNWVPGWENTEDILKFLFYILFLLFIIYLLVIFNESERRIPIQQTGSGLISDRKRVNYLPLKLNSAGVIPVIFASAILTIPMTIAQLIEKGGAEESKNKFVIFAKNYLSLNTTYGNIIYAFLVITFTFVYSQMQINPERLAKEFHKSGTYIIGIKQGKMTEIYLKRIINRLSCIGGVILAFFSVFSFIFSQVASLPINLSIGGIGIIIVVSVSLETLKQFQGRIIQQRFLHKKSEIEEFDKKSW
jgi:preprotein translocase subunit SecY